MRDDTHILTVYEHWGTNWTRRVGQFFTLGEVCQWDPRREIRDKQVKQNVLTLARLLDQVRLAWGGPVIITSWYRPSHVNREVGGAPNSMHLTGAAADVRPANGRGWQFEEWLDNGLWHDRALGRGQRSGRGFTHLDLRPGRIRWDY